MYINVVIRVTHHIRDRSRVASTRYIGPLPALLLYSQPTELIGLSCRPTMETLSARLKTFTKNKQSKTSSKSASLQWPHPDTFTANPQSLAEAGFYFNAEKDYPDNVECFMCGKQLDGWEPDDNPFEIHVRKCPKCPWATARCSLEFDLDSDGMCVLL